MKAIDDAKRQINDTKARFARAARIVLASPVLMGLSAVGAIAFGTQLVYARDRLPPIGSLSLVQVGLPALDLGAAGDQLKEAANAAARQGAPDSVTRFLSEHPQLITPLNIAGFALCGLFLAWAVWTRARTYREAPAHAALRAPGPAGRR